MSYSTVLVVEDDASLREALCDTLDLAGYDVATAEDGSAALDVLSSHDVGLVISDVQMKPMDGNTLLKKIKSNNPELPVLLMTAHGSVQNAVEAMREGAADYLLKPFDANALIKMVARYFCSEHAESEDFIAQDKKSQALIQMASRVAKSDATVMITGDSGVGKEVLARYIHQHSRRSEKPFIAINCAAIPENMLEATLFGYEKGAFTGAYQASPGKFEQAQGGTLLLDEISEMDLGLQAKLLRVLQEREVERLGGRKVISLDVRVLATSNRRMMEEVAAQRFREDLFYRLNVFPLYLEPLCDRPADILPLVQRLMGNNRDLNGARPPELSTAAKNKLLSHSWPGNVRELDNIMQRALILKSGQTINVDDLQFETDNYANSRAVVSEEPIAVIQAMAPVAMTSKDNLKSHEQNMILETLRLMSGNRKSTAAKLGVSQRTLRYKLAKMRDAGILIQSGGQRGLEEF
ncbi:MAG: sigma-54-dependent Fis family transcriptional regulator [Thiotrichaceae bacterium]|nr:sigma-54-dependent Fis family transcriptional regulator [Thiotrichaceae bacterium]PCI15123.1 MAG: sigma-54-dependent Fis family transcriptional regulator [Thiotrichales bacterium]